MLDIKNDSLLWESLVTIDANEYLNFKAIPRYSSHIVRLYEKANGQRYYIFFQVNSSIGDVSRISQSGWMEDDERIYFDCAWGKFIMNYNYPQYKSLKKYIWLDDVTPIYCVASVELGQKLEDINPREFYNVSQKYRLENFEKDN